MPQPHIDPDGGEGGLYVHVPFCLRKCGYCDFYSRPLHAAQADQTVTALIAELDRQLGQLPFAIRTIFVGGGTPTVLPMPALEKLFARLGQVAKDYAVEEFTVEANPDTFNSGVALLLKRSGVNRISLGAQSFIPGELQTLDRAHNPQAVMDGVKLAHQLGFEHLSLDLIFGIPGQTRETWPQSLDTAAALPIDHLSCYGLTYEPDTALTARKEAGEIQPMDETLETELFERTGSSLAELGFDRYEISNFARKGAEMARAKCRHNLFYWNNQPYLGIGPAAASLVGGERRKNVADVAAYLAAIQEGRSPVVSRESRDQEGFAHDLAMLRLRLVAGIDLADFARRSGLHARQFFREAVQKHVSSGLLEDTGTHLRLTARGMLLANVVMTDFV